MMRSVGMRPHRVRLLDVSADYRGMTTPTAISQPKTPQRAAQIWPLLAWCALHRQTITYEEVGALIGVPPVGLGGFLDAIDAYCVGKGLPRLAALVVSKKTNVPSLGFHSPEDGTLGELHARAFTWNWLEAESPTPEAFASLAKAA